MDDKTTNRLLNSEDAIVPGSVEDLESTHAQIIAFIDMLLDTQTALHPAHKRLVARIGDASRAVIERRS